MNKRSKQIIAQGVYLMVFALTMLAAGAVFAQEVQVPQSITELTSATPASDWSMRMWRSLFGEFADDPFSTLGAPTTLLGSVFIVFNGAIFVVGTIWATYSILGGVVGTAHEGEVLGKRMSTVWFPIRMVTGIAGMVPIFGGFTINQAIMMFLTTIGIGIANVMWSTGVNNTAQFQGLMNNQAFAPTAVPDARRVARDMFTASVCLIGQTQNALLTGEEKLGRLHLPRIEASSSAEDGTSSYLYGTQADPTKCGQATVKASPSWLSGGDYRSSSSPFAFRSGAVDYRAIETQSIDAKITGLGRMQAETQALALEWYIARETALLEGGEVPPIPLAKIDAIGAGFTRSTALDLAERLANKTPEAITEAAKANMLAVGWFGAGSWFSTFAEANAASADAAKAVKLISDGPEARERLASSTVQVLDVVTAGMAAEEKRRAGGSTRSGSGDGSSALLDSAIEDSCAAMPVLGGLVGTASGNCSLGQSVVSAAIRASAVGSGGGGSAGLDDQGLVNPIIMMKNMGDYVMSFSTTVIAASGAVQGAAWIAENASDAVKSIPLVGKAVGAIGAASGAVGEAAGTIKTIAIVLLVLGAAMAIYIPMIPFITWIGAILAYAASMIEGLAGATLHSMAHLDSEGEGMGQRTAHGYMFYINAVARPGLMIIGFFFASAIMISVGTLQAQMFLPAMANVQGNSMTGLLSIAMFLLIFFVINLTLITASFNLVYVITDQVIGFIGGQVGQKLGQDTEDKANNMFLMAARVGPSAATEMSRKAGGAAGAAGAAGAGGGAGKGGKQS